MSDNNFKDEKSAPQNGEGLESVADEFVNFLKDPTSRTAMKDFMVQTYKDFEAKRFAQFKAKVENERTVDALTAHEAHATGNIAPLVHEQLSMHETEESFVRGLKITKKSITRSVDERVEEINRLLAGIGGFCSQLKSCFARSTVVFLEQEDPNRPFRERLIFSINLPSYELKSSWEGMGQGGGTAEAATGADGRTQVQVTWDNAVNALAQIIESTGLKPKYCKNDRHFGRFVMKQDLRHNSQLPDEYFSFTLDYNTSEKIQDMCGPYNSIVAGYDKKLEHFSRKLDSYAQDSTSERFLGLKQKYLAVLKDHDFFVASTPDPNQLDEGLLFVIEVSTLKDYQVVKDRMQSIMTRYILHLSKIAASESLKDADLEHELKRLHANQARANGAQAAQHGPQATDESADAESSIQEYEVDPEHLKPVKKKKTAA